MFELYRNDKFVLYYENQNHISGFTHLLNFQNLSTGERTGMWVDPTNTITDPKLLEKILNLEYLKTELEPDAYAHEVACFIETLMQNASYTCLEITSLAKDILKHHKNPQELYHTLSNIDLSYIRNEDQNRFHNLVEMQKAVAAFVKTLRDYIVGLLGILITAEDAQASKSSLNRFGAFADARGTGEEDLDAGKTFTLSPQLNN